MACEVFDHCMYSSKWHDAQRFVPVYSWPAGGAGSGSAGAAAARPPPRLLAQYQSGRRGPAVRGCAENCGAGYKPECQRGHNNLLPRKTKIRQPTRHGTTRLRTEFSEIAVRVHGIHPRFTSLCEATRPSQLGTLHFSEIL